MPERQEQGHRWFAAWYDRLTSGAEQKLLGKVRRRLLEEAEGDVLEIGAGTGASLPHYPKEARVVATEPDPFMLARAEARLAGLGLDDVELRIASAEALPFEDASFDHAVSTLVLCTVDDAPRALAELRRVLRPGGTLRFLEHVRNDDSRFWGTVQDVIVPAWRYFAAGCYPNRRTLQTIVDAGFTIAWLEQTRLGPGTPGIYGVARPAL